MGQHWRKAKKSGGRSYSDGCSDFNMMSFIDATDKSASELLIKLIREDHENNLPLIEHMLKQCPALSNTKWQDTWPLLEACNMKHNSGETISSTL
jgi:hypothetical protein